MNLPPDIATHLQHAASEALVRALSGVEGFVSQAVGEDVALTSGPAGQIVISPKSKRLPKNPAKKAGHLLLPLLIGSAVLQLSKRQGQ